MTESQIAKIPGYWLALCNVINRKSSVESVMLNQEQIAWLQPVIKALQIIVASLIFGAVTAGIALGVVAGNRQFTSAVDAFAMLGIAMFVGCAVAAWFFPNVTLNTEAAKLSDRVKAEGDSLSRETIMNFSQPLQTSTIIRYALIEGPVFANIMFWFVTGNVFNLAVAVAGIGLMILLFPFNHRVVQTVESMIDTARRA